ncbi:bifunctional cobalt-precorrin-7 (C(5))-methyltransferase/cobalt-precorrin-6B (C(15))-methyltransferase [Synechococcus sp. CS-197]|uniref:bifunctional cobalt-precorrin-7 (C(5))-methyltransferase/cobalt-precorrin-6B (C(15))-methyltransferase n=1 Tax=Synechococcus sp. CS-197 TaxID=2847985 RepID=UPI0001525790|nr:bifunctional cobalt-precorrin-7 (C(5))-methyltransferase/cobalt-precorrin-6B (C(15))-methyltransferase [Synechococcus sp. CS-197]MCT0249891.1 bifunctional cobalt-precorrin-7 (C(5))-methyltransferase/cobalt-precorrin-6B (C(15))-methyltransferase [Synechococcus sp. CS-197]CAK24133.1 Precorrin-6Y methylase [Synechococcus sp. WH 7803]
MIDVIGTDAGAPASLPPMHQHLVQNADLVAAPKRLLPQLVDWLGSRADDQQRLVSDDPIALSDALAPLAPTLRIVVLASGDPLWFGIGRVLIERLGSERLRFHPAPSSMQLAFARLGKPWQGAEWISLHGRDPSPLAQRLQKRPAALAVLTDPGRGGVEEVRAILRGSGLESSYSLWLCEALGHHDERVQRLEATRPCPDDLHPLHLVVLLAQPPAASAAEALPLFGIADGDYLQHDDRPGLMTKREVRIQLLADLELPEQGVLWDLGAGTGSVGLEALRLRPQLQLMAIERRSGGGALIQANAQRLGVAPASVLEGDARTLLPQLPDPDRVLVGGGGRQRATLLKAVIDRLRPGGVVVIPLATLEALAELRPVLEQAELQLQISQQQAWRGQPLAEGTRLAPMNPVLILKGTKAQP